MDLESLLEHQSSLQSKMTSLYTMLYVFVDLYLIELDALKIKLLEFTDFLDIRIVLKCEILKTIVFTDQIYSW